MWMFNVSSGGWTFLSGSNTRDQFGIYGTQRLAAANNGPGARQHHSMAIHPSGEFIFVFGGDGLGATSWGKLLFPH